ncbi:N,N-dimethylaniline monooxygenase [Aureococcus anophagefferens]|nr:N,N-dimethylaniline monooxygenase [Aureococcus anophagefferens]
MDLPICVIGTGASGTVATKELHEAGLEVDCYEIQDGPGGLYKRDNYEDACHTSSKIYTSYACFPPKDGLVQCGHYTLSEYCDYQRRFTEHFGIVDLIKYEHKVDAVAKLGDGTWEVTVTDLKKGKSFVKKYRAVVCCSGTHTHAPEAKSVSFVQGFDGDVLHSHQFRSSKDFAGSASSSSAAARAERRVLQGEPGRGGVVATLRRTGHMTPRGPQMPETDHIDKYHWHLADPKNQMPEASFDLDLSAAHFATATWQMGGVSSYRDVVGTINEDFYPGFRNNLCIGTHINSQFGTKNMGLSSAVARYGLVPKPPIASCAGKRVTFEDGSVAEDVDAIVLCIGYAPDIEFLDKGLKMQVANPRNSLKHCVHPDVDNFFLVGFIRPAFGNIPSLSELQARWVAKLLTGAVAPPFGGDKMKMKAQIEKDRAEEEAQYGTSSVRVKALTNYFVSANDIASYAKLHPDYLKIAATDPLLGLKILLGQTTGFTFRLNDDYDLYRSRLMEMPTTHLVPLDLCLFLTLVHAWLLLGNVVRFPSCVPQDDVPALARLGAAAVLFSSKVYRYAAVYPAAFVTVLLVLMYHLNSHRLEAVFRNACRRPMRFVLLTLLTMPLDLAGTWFRAYLTKKDDAWNGPKHIAQEFKYRSKMEACLFGKTSQKWSVHG